MADAYDIEEAFREIENQLLSSMSRNLGRHTTEEIATETQYKMWQAEQLKFLEECKNRPYSGNKKFIKKYLGINEQVKDLLKRTGKDAALKEENKILRLIAGTRGAKVQHTPLDEYNGRYNKLNALLDATQKDLEKAEYATLRMMDDQYRKTIFNSQVYLNTESGTLRQAIDMATKDFYGAGISSIEYKNGARVNISSYSEMYLRTADKRAKLQGEAVARNEYGLNLVIITQRGSACPLCMNYCGRVCIDDVYGDGKEDGKHPLLSEFIAGGLYHPNCKDSHTTYIEGITEEKPATKEMQEEAVEKYNLQQQQRYNERNIRKYKRLEENSLDEKDKDYYKNKRKDWQAKQRDFVNSHSELVREYDRERIR